MNERAVRERWRRANAILDCSGSWLDDCPFSACDRDTDAQYVYLLTDYSDVAGHEAAASVELDGIACEDLP